jgi:hypothetical protein
MLIGLEAKGGDEKTRTLCRRHLSLSKNTNSRYKPYNPAMYTRIGSTGKSLTSLADNIGLIRALTLFTLSFQDYAETQNRQQALPGRHRADVHVAE